MADKDNKTEAATIGDTDALLDDIGWKYIIKDESTRKLLQTKYPTMMHQVMKIEPKQFNNQELVTIGQGQAIRGELFNYILRVVRARTGLLEGLAVGVMTVVTVIALLLAYGHIGSDISTAFDSATSRAVSVFASKEEREALAKERAAVKALSTAERSYYGKIPDAKVKPQFLHATPEDRKAFMDANPLE